MYNQLKGIHMKPQGHLFSRNGDATREDRTAVKHSALQTKLTWSEKNASQDLYTRIKQVNEATAGRGLKYLRSFLSNVVEYPSFVQAKALLDLINGPKPSDAVTEAKALLTQTYEDADSQFIASQIALAVSKYPFDGLPEVAAKNGLKVFTDGERRNRHMNALLRARRANGVAASDPFLMHMKQFVRELLGEAPMFTKWADGAGWGPGASVGVTGQFTNFARKLLAETWTVTPTALPYAITIAKRLPVFWEILGLTRTYTVNESPHLVVCADPDEFTVRFMARVVMVGCNELALVPKDADKDRVIAKEPLLNQLVQMAADVEMRLRLRRVGIDLRDQRRNQEWAREGSLMVGSNPRCTVDLTNASGSIFIELVRECLDYCPDWFIVLNAIRSPSYRNPLAEKPDLQERYHMFSSMGNGTTFPLETIIFASICYAAHRYCGTTPDFRCYGDDIVIRQNEALVVLEKLRYFGMKANAAKTFIFGPFRESCGSDWYLGENVRPVVFDTPLEKIEERIRIHNALARLKNPSFAAMLSNCCRWWFPPFVSRMIRPYGDDTDEAVDGRHIMGPPSPHQAQCTTFGTPMWYGLVFSPISDEDIKGHARYSVALHYAALLGATSETPFAARRETRMRVARFSHAGNTSNWLPLHGHLGTYPGEWQRVPVMGPSRYAVHFRPSLSPSGTRVAST